MMDTYLIVLFLHIVGALGFFVALGLEWMSLRQLWRATIAEQVRALLHVSAGTGRVGVISMLLLLGSGFHMMAEVWGGVAWIIVALGTIVLLGVLTVTLLRTPMAAIEKAVAVENGPISASLYQLLHQPRLRIAIHARVAITLGIVFLMTVKPDLSGSLLTIGIATVLGLISAVSMPNRQRVQEGMTM
jgi:hypothetical protein